MRKALQYQWEVFQQLPKAMQEVLKTNALEEVNKVLGAMDAAEAEAVVGALDSGF